MEKPISFFMQALILQLCIIMVVVNFFKEVNIISVIYYII